MGDTVLELRSEVKGGTGIIYLAGEADAHTTPLLKAEIDKLLAAGVLSLIYECRDLTYFASAAIGATAQAHKAVRSRGGDLYLVSVADDVKEMLKLLVARQITVLPNLASALKAAG